MWSPWRVSAFLAPGKTPPDVANKLHAALIKAIALNDAKAGFAHDGMDSGFADASHRRLVSTR
jgi:hypothetical protein